MNTLIYTTDIANVILYLLQSLQSYLRDIRRSESARLED